MEAHLENEKEKLKCFDLTHTERTILYDELMKDCDKVVFEAKYIDFEPT